MGKIIILPQEIRDRISAGEVVERPASVIKELIENSIDAFADSIYIEIKKAGKSYINVKDNGEGMDEKDLELSIQSYSTSKLSSMEDLFRIKSLGFRGEALASIASVSQLYIVSRREEDALASYIQVEGGKIKDKGKIQHLSGTSVEVKNLFFNTPARRKFLKSDPTEYAHILDIVIKFSLAYPQIEFHFVSNTKKILSLNKSGHLERLQELFPELSEKLIKVEAQTPIFNLLAFLSKPELNYPRRIKQYIFVNGRAIVSGLIYHILDQAYQGLIEGRNYPAVFLFLEMAPPLLDLNVHPTKREVRFREEGKIYELLLGLLKEQLQAENVLTTFHIPKKGYFNEKEYELGGFKIAEVQQKLIDVKERVDYLVYKNRYIIWVEKEAINIIDQHAGWEKVLYQKFKKALEEKKIQRQKLLIPEVVNLNLASAEVLKQNLILFEQLGFEIKEFGQNSFIIHTRPIFLKKSAREVIEEVIAEIQEGEKAGELREKIISSLACHSAIKSGDKLASEEVGRLIEEVKNLKIPYCPHGRPALIVIRWDELERQFKRR